MTMAIVVLLGLGLVVYARQSAPSANTPPTVNDHWHVSYGIYACDQQLKDLTGTKEDPVDPLFVKYGIHSHNDGVIHWHPQALATGRRAKLGLFLQTYGVKVNTDGITFGNDQNGGKDYLVASTKCKDKSGKEVEAQVSVTVWEQYDKPDAKPASASNLPELGAADSGSSTSTTVAGATSSTVKGATSTSVVAPTTTAG